MYIGGVGVARGYLSHPELTRERFVPNHLSAVPGTKLYKTGDLGRYLADGQIAFMGRIDEQIKIQGYRIEPNEPTAVLARHPMLQASLVVAREDTPGDKRLVAYVVPRFGTQPTDKDLRYFLKNELPDFMVPALFVRVDSMPLNASGKIDRSALPAPTESNILRDENYVGAQTPIEGTVTTILAGLLDLKKLGANDNFFLLGGNSLLGAQMIAKVRDRFGVELSLLSLFDHPTASQLSAEIVRLLVAKLSAMTEDDARRLAVTFATNI
jgi:acyl carrier protein